MSVFLCKFSAKKPPKKQRAEAEREKLEKQEMTASCKFPKKMLKENTEFQQEFRQKSQLITLYSDDLK
jgi:hypothetical protein